MLGANRSEIVHLSLEKVSPEPTFYRKADCQQSNICHEGAIQSDKNKNMLFQL